MRVCVAGLVVVLGAGMASSASSADAQEVRALDAEAYLMDRREEVSLARSAGPDAVSEDATILVLTSAGEYEVASRGSNEWVCFVGRGWTGPAPIRDGRRVLSDGNFDADRRGPQCFNGLAVQSVLEWHRLTTRLFLTGHTAEQVEDRVAEALDSGDLSIPKSGAMSYMLSARQQLNPRVGRWNPHYMFYTPYADGSALYGTRGITTDLPFVTDGGGPWAITTVVAPAFSDGTPAPFLSR
ncbi:MAG: hypothetical protein AAF389_01905 [Gemmatimonadota bacterium]